MWALEEGDKQNLRWEDLGPLGNLNELQLDVMVEFTRKGLLSDSRFIKKIALRNSEPICWSVADKHEDVVATVILINIIIMVVIIITVLLVIDLVYISELFHRSDDFHI